MAQKTGPARASANALRFVAVRPPDTSRPDARVMITSDAKNDFSNEFDKLRHQGLTHEDARSRASGSVIKRNDYVLRDPARQSFVLALYDFQARANNLKKPDTLQGVRPAVEAVLKAALGSTVTVESASKSKALADLSQLLWSNYFANVVAPETRPRDLPLLILALQVLHLANPAAPS
jgi:hypothetical protein